MHSSFLAVKDTFKWEWIKSFILNLHCETLIVGGVCLHLKPARPKVHSRPVAAFTERLGRHIPPWPAVHADPRATLHEDRQLKCLFSDGCVLKHAITQNTSGYVMQAWRFGKRSGGAGRTHKNK